MNPQAAMVVGEIKGLLNIVRILAIIFGVLLALGGLLYAVFAYWAWAACSTVVYGVAGYCSGALVWFLIWPIMILIFGVIDIVIFMQMGSIRSLLDQGRLQEAKSKTLIWAILGLLLGGFLVGIILILAYMKYDSAINAAAQPAYQAAPPPAYGGGYGYAAPPAAAPPAAAPPAAPPAAPAPPPAPTAQAAPTCPKCGRPATFVAQYNRYYCYSCSQYV